MVCFAFPECNPAVQNWQPEVGMIVENFGTICRVVEAVPGRGVLLRIMPINGQGGAGQQFIANPSKCRPVV